MKLKNYTVRELRKIARDLSLHGYANLRKADLILAIRTARRKRGLSATHIYGVVTVIALFVSLIPYIPQVITFVVDSLRPSPSERLIVEVDHYKELTIAAAPRMPDAEIAQHIRQIAWIEAAPERFLAIPPNVILAEMAAEAGRNRP